MSIKTVGHGEGYLEPEDEVYVREARNTEKDGFCTCICGCSSGDDSHDGLHDPSHDSLQS